MAILFLIKQNSTLLMGEMSVFSLYQGHACRGELEFCHDLAQAGQVQIRTWQVHVALKGWYDVRRHFSDDSSHRSMYWTVERVTTLLSSGQLLSYDLLSL